MIGRIKILSLLVFLAPSGCRDAESRTEQSSRVSADTSTGKAVGASVPVAEPSGVHTDAPELDKKVDASAAADVVKRYYDAIGRRDYESAYTMWEGSGEASGQTLIQFENGFAQTERTTAIIGDSIRVGAAAGSQYVNVPVTVDAVLRGGKLQQFVGTYTVRRAIVDGATLQQRAWHVYSAHLTQRAPR
jgi:hypothetical protein